MKRDACGSFLNEVSCARASGQGSRALSRKVRLRRRIPHCLASDEGRFQRRKKASRTYLVFTDTGDLAGFFSICANVFEHNLMSAASRRNKPDPIPVVLIGRLAVDQRYQGGGLGAAMLDLAVTISRRIAELCGAVFVAVHPISESAAKFYS
ncbi:GNAT family N-acetyltransferase, partial [Sutterella massiliensis]